MDTQKNITSTARDRAKAAALTENRWERSLGATRSWLTAVGILNIVGGVVAGFALMAQTDGYDSDGAVQPYLGLGLVVIASGIVMAVLFLALAQMAGYLAYAAGRDAGA